MTQSRSHDPAADSRQSADASSEPETTRAKQILEEALRQFDAVSEDSADYAQFLASARTLGRQPCTASPVVTELVRCALRLSFPNTQWDTEGSRLLIQNLSAMLFADPRSAARLEKLWNRLQQDM